MYMYVIDTEVCDLEIMVRCRRYRARCLRLRPGRRVKVLTTDVPVNTTGLEPREADHAPYVMRTHTT